MKKTCTLEDYACVLARSYALSIGRLNKNMMNTLIGPNPFEAELKRESELIYKWLNEHECLETPVVERVRKLIPESSWDKGLNNAVKDLKGAMETGNMEDLKDKSAKLESFLKPDWKEREILEKVFRHED